MKLKDNHQLYTHRYYLLNWTSTAGLEFEVQLIFLVKTRSTLNIVSYN